MKHLALPFLFLVLTSFAVPLLRYTSLLFSPITNNGVRFISGSIFLFIIALFRYKSKLLEFFPKERKIQLLLLCTACLMSINMVFFIKGLSLSSAFTGSMFTTFGIPVTALVSMFYFPDEREKSFNVFFFTGMFICVLGSLVFINRGGSDPQANAGTFYLFISVCSQVVLNNLIKHIAHQLPVLIIGLFNSFLTGISLLILAFLTGSIKELATADTHSIVVLIFAGVYGIFVGMMIGFSVIKKNGITTFNIMQLLTPITTAMVSYIIMKETITPPQFLGGMIILVGAYICIFGKNNFNSLLKKFQKTNNQI